jgi:4-amino-4-deoxy-L-arabinose transferase-like glycosyltransferase
MAAGRSNVALAAATLLLLWCVGLFARGYWTPDEPREAALASSMVAQLQPLPVLAGHAFAEKPPLTYWLAGLAQRAFGMGPAVARLPQLGYAVVAFLAMLSLARRLLATGRPRRSTDPMASSARAAARSAAWVAAMLFACGALVCQVQVWLDTDALLLAGVCLALEGMYAGLAVDAGGAAAAAGADAQARRARLRGYLRMHLGLALAFFAKNFAAWLVPVLAFLCFIAWERRWRELWRWEFHVGGLLLAGAILAWVSAVAAQPDGAHSLRVLFWNNLLGRALPLADAAGETYSSGHSNSPGKYLLELPLYLLPWCFIAAAALQAAWRAVRVGGAGAGAGAGVNAYGARSAWRFAACVALPGLLVLSLAATARGIYAAPCMAGFALLAGLWAAGGGEAGGAEVGGVEARTWRWPLRATAVLIGLLATLVLTATVALQWTAERASWPVFIVSASACALALGWSLRPRQPQRAGAAARAQELLRLATAWCLLLSLGALALLGAVNRTQDIVALATRVAQSAAPGPMLLWNPDETTLAWAQLYLPAGSWSALDAGRSDSAAQLAQRLRSAPATVVVSLLPGHGWSYAKWREYLRPHAVTASLSMIPLSQAARDPALAAARLSVTTRIERPGGRGYLLWRLR